MYDPFGCVDRLFSASKAETFLKKEEVMVRDGFCGSCLGCSFKTKKTKLKI
jgi:hypothetical protein